MMQVCGVHKRFGEQVILRDISLSLASGEVAALIGPSGGGKSTLLRCMMGLESFQGGSVTIGEHVLSPEMTDLARLKTLQALRGRVGMVFQQFHLFAHMSALDNVASAPMHVLGKSRDEAVAEAQALLDRVGVLPHAHKKPGKLSGGQQQRVAIARALAMKPEVILFDEPTSALDPRMTDEVLGVMTDLAECGQAMIVVTHAMSFARRVASHVHVFAEGRIVESGTAEQIFEDPRELVTRSFLNTALEPKVAVGGGRRF